MALRVYLKGAAAALRARLAGDPHIEIVDLIDQAEAIMSMPPARRDADALVESLTAREHDVLALLADGLSNRDIAHRLSISEHTVKFHLASIFGKLGAATRTEAVQRGVRLGIIEI